MLEPQKASREQRVIVPGMQRHSQLRSQEGAGTAGSSEPRVETRPGSGSFAAELGTGAPRRNPGGKPGKELQLDSLKQGLGEKSANFR